MSEAPRKKESPEPIARVASSRELARKVSPLRAAAWPFGLAGLALGVGAVATLTLIDRAHACGDDRSLFEKLIRPLTPTRTAGEAMPVQPISPPMPLGGTAAPVQPSVPEPTEPSVIPTGAASAHAPSPRASAHPSSSFEAK
jgi:hypothetical protein